jgi:uncharacterized protein (TIGR02147 family)
MQARRDLSKSSAIKIAETLAMPAEAKKYFLLLVNHNNAREADQREQLMQDIVFCKSQYFTKQDEDGKALEYFQEWYHPVIREMTALDDFQSDPEWINVRLFLKLLPRQIEKSLELLERLGLIRFDAVRQRFVSTGEQVMPSRAVARLAHIRFHQKACDNARESMTVVPANRRDMNVMTLSITEDMAEQIKKIFLAACEQAMRLESSATQKTEVYQVNVQMFALTRLSHEQKDEA